MDVRIIIYSAGYTPDKERKICVYSFSHETGFQIVKICETKEEAGLLVEELKKKKCG